MRELTPESHLLKLERFWLPVLLWFEIEELGVARGGGSANGGSGGRSRDIVADFQVLCWMKSEMQ